MSRRTPCIDWYTTVKDRKYWTLWITPKLERKLDFIAMSVSKGHLVRLASKIRP